MAQPRTLTIVFLVFATISQVFSREPICSKFHYEEKLLEKMIRLEIKVEDMEAEIKHTLKSITTFMENMEQKMDNKVGDMNNDIKLNLDNFKQNMESFEDDWTNRKNELQLIADKVNVPNIAFNMYNVKDVNVVKKGQVFIFTKILLNEGGGYNPDTGVFTASVAGLYYFTAHVCGSPGKYVYYGIIVDDQRIALSVHRDQDEYSCSSVSAVTFLKTASTVSVQSTINSSLNILYQDSSRRITFSGAFNICTYR